MTKKALLFCELCLLLAASTSTAESIDKTVSFTLEEWIELDASDGPVTLHRMRIKRETGGLTKSKLFRPGNDEYLETVQVQVEFSNDSSRDWELHLDVEWTDDKGRPIDGYSDTENLDDREHREIAHVTLSTLRYGLERARKLKIRFQFYPD